MKRFDFNFETQSSDRIYILWDNIRNEKENIIYPEPDEIQDFLESLGNHVYDFQMIENDKSVASYYGYDNCIIYGNE
jgi:hypothetical protein